jgi:hypothetical protein
MGGKSDPPPAPDYKAAAEQTAAGNLAAARQQTAANRVNSYTPFGSMTYTNLGNDRWRQDVKLAPDQQKLLDMNTKTQLGMAGMQDAGLNAVKQAQSQPFSLNGVPQAGQVYDPQASTNTATESIMSRLQPMMDRQTNQTETQLANMGLTRGSEAWNNAKMDLNQSQNDARIQAALQGINLGMQQSSLGFGQQQQAHQTGIQDLMLQRSQPLNELNALRTGSQLTMPTFQGAPQQGFTGGANYMGAAQNQYSAGMDAYNAAQAGQQGLMTGLGSLAGAAMMFSDARLKKNIRHVATSPSGLKLYEYDNVVTGLPEVGVLAQDILETHPHAVQIHQPSGYYMVDYSQLG